jgi:acyl-CoA synthetase (NDP forming)
MSEALSKQLLSPFGFPFAVESLVDTASEAGDVADAMGYPVVAKLNGDSIGAGSHPSAGDGNK